VALEAGVRTIGIDAPSIDRSVDVGSDSLPALETHRILAREHAVIAENLTRLEMLLDLEPSPGAATVWLLPLALDRADGSPVRAVAQLTEA
jgi:kynurenine formamidase